MERELKIVLTLFLVFFIYGMGSFFNTGGFITPFFLDKIILFLIALSFFLMNRKEKYALYLFLYIPAILSFAMLDDFTLSFMASKLNSIELINTLSSPTIRLVFIAVFFLYFIVAVILFYKEFKNKLISGVLLNLIVATVVLLGTELVWIPGILMSLFLLLYFIVIGYDKEKRPKFFDIISAQFLLLFLLSLFEYFI